MKTLKKRSQLQEKSVAESMSAKVVVASGAFWSSKGDVRNDKFLIECKTTLKSYYSITSKVWEKIALEAIKDNLRIPLLFVDLKDSDRYVVFNPHDFDTSISSYEIVMCGNNESPKSYKFNGYTDTELPLLFRLKPCKLNQKNIVLMVMSFDDFVRVYEKELNPSVSE